MSGFRSSLYEGRVMHRRLRPFSHRFDYRVFSLYLDLEELGSLDRKLPFFGHNRFQLFSFHNKDHGGRDGQPLKPWIEGELTKAGIDLDGGKVMLHCFPRILGYVFNPLSTWFCYHSDGRLLAVLYEVRNTFGDKHGYLIPVKDHEAGKPIVQSCDKTALYRDGSDLCLSRKRARRATVDLDQGVPAPKREPRRNLDRDAYGRAAWADWQGLGERLRALSADDGEGDHGDPLAGLEALA